MTPSKDFLDRMKSEFPNLRLRYSKARGEWCVEQKVGPAMTPTAPISEVEDELIRARDGYALVMTIREGDRMPCPECGATLKVPVMRTAEVTCSRCKLMGKEGRYAAAHYPFGEALLQHLRRIDPSRTWHEEIVATLEYRNKLKMASHERDFSTFNEAVVKENFPQLLNIPSVGYTGKEQYA